MERVFLGMLTPSSNTALEPLTSAMVSSLPGVSAHFSRFTVTEISLRDASLQQFELVVEFGALELLAVLFQPLHALFDDYEIAENQFRVYILEIAHRVH